MLRLSAEAEILFLCCHQLLELLLAQLSVAVPIKLCKHRLDLLLAQLLRHLVSKSCILCYSPSQVRNVISKNAIG